MQAIIRQGVKLLLSVLLLPLIILLGAAGAIGNYLAVETALELQGTEPKPLSAFSIFGGFFDSFLPDATLADVAALTLVSVLYIGVACLINRAFRLAHLIRDRRLYLQQGDTKSAELVIEYVKACVAWIALLSVLVVPVVYWDVKLFQFRAVIGALGIDNPILAAQQPGWAEQIAQNGNLFGWELAGIGAIGYLALNILAAVLLEFNIQAIDNSWIGVTDAVTRELQPSSTSEPEAVVADTGPEVAATEQNGSATAESPAGASPAAQPSAARTEEHANVVRLRADQGSSTLVAENVAPANVPSAANTTAGMAAPTRQSSSAAPPPTEPLQDVIGGNGTRVSLSEARRNRDRFWIDANTREIWDVQHRRALFDEVA